MDIRILGGLDGPALADRLGDYLDRTASETIVSASNAVYAVDGDLASDTVCALERAGARLARGSATTIVAASETVLRDAAGRAQGAASLEIAALLRAAASVVTRPALRLRDRRLEPPGAHVMGILNVTPDSFFDDGRYAALDAARARAWTMVDEGASLVDVGGRSYAHWNVPVDADEEIRRVVPLVEALVRDGYPLPLSIDTTNARVAAAALAAGAALINDCSGLSDPKLAATVAHSDAALIVMHLKGDLNVRSPELYVYPDPMAEIGAFLAERIAAARRDGVASDAVAIDPGLEFGKEPATDLAIVERLGELRTLGAPLLLAASRKSFIGRIFERPAKELLAPSLAVAAAGVLAGALIVRAHDVRETADLCRMLAALQPQTRGRLAFADEMPR